MADAGAHVPVYQVGQEAVLFPRGRAPVSGDQDVQRLVVVLFHRLVQGEVAKCVEVDDGPGDYRRRQQHAEQDGEQHPPVREAPLGDELPGRQQPAGDGRQRSDAAAAGRCPAPALSGLMGICVAVQLPGDELVQCVAELASLPLPDVPALQLGREALGPGGESLQALPPAI